MVNYRRIVVKIGTNVLTGGAGDLDLKVMASLVAQIARLRREGREILLVTSGAIAAGRHVLGAKKERRDVTFRQMLAAVGQSRLMHTYQELFDQHDLLVAQALLTRADISERQGYLSVRDSLMGLLELGVVPIINENDVVTSEEIDENAFGDNDTLSALLANLMDADLLVMLTDIGGLYTADPNIDADAALIPRVEIIDSSVIGLAKEEERHSWSRGGMAAKLQVASLATAWGVAVVIVGGTEDESLIDVVYGRERGTIFPPSTSKMESRKRWLLSGLSNRGEILVDSGAADALRLQHSSLLAAGVKETHGEFNRHDVVLIIGMNGEKLACGVANYSSSEISDIKGLRSDSIENILGHRYGDEVVHRNNMALL
jgi:glutamate 5-kinase